MQLNTTSDFKSMLAKTQTATSLPARPPQARSLRQGTSRNPDVLQQHLTGALWPRPFRSSEGNSRHMTTTSQCNSLWEHLQSGSTRHEPSLVPLQFPLQTNEAPTTHLGPKTSQDQKFSVIQNLSHPEKEWMWYDHSGLKKFKQQIHM